MANLKKIWNNFIAQPDIWFFYGFLLTFTLSIRKVIKFYPIAGQFNEYAGIYFYLSDIFLILTLIVWGIIILRNKSEYLSSIKHYFALSKPLIRLLLIFNLWIFVSIFWSDNQTIALFRAIKILEFSLLFIYVATKLFHPSKNVPPSQDCSTPAPDLSNVPRGTFERFVGWNTTIIFHAIIFLGLFQAIIGICQFFVQHSVGLFWLKESLISPDLLGVAKVIFNGEKFIRAYGLFPHPNILGGFLLLSIVLTWTYFKLFHACPIGRNCSTWNNFVPSGVEHFAENAWKKRLFRFLPIFAGVQILALLLTFSKSAIIGLAFATLYILFHACPVKSICSTWNKLIFTGLEHKRKIILILAILALLVVIFKPNTNSLFFKSLNERLPYFRISQETIAQNPLIGLGFGQFVLNMDKTVPRLSADEAGGTPLEPWQFQPVHNVFLLIWSELGIFGVILFIWFLWKLFYPSHNVPHGTSDGTSACPVGSNCSTWNNCIPTGEEHNKINTIFKAILLGFLFISLFDHYLWDIQQGQIMLWLVLGMLSVTSIKQGKGNYIDNKQ